MTPPTEKLAEAKKLIEKISKKKSGHLVIASSYIDEIIQAASLISYEKGREQQKNVIVEIINDRKERFKEESIQSHKLAHNSYGAGADWGMVEACTILLDDLGELQ